MAEPQDWVPFIALYALMVWAFLIMTGLAIRAVRSECWAARAGIRAQCEMSRTEPSIRSVIPSAGMGSSDERTNVLAVTTESSRKVTDPLLAKIDARFDAIQSKITAMLEYLEDNPDWRPPRAH